MEEAEKTVKREQDFAGKLGDENVKLEKLEGKAIRKRHGVRGSVRE